jgi:hypothetical protein
MDKKTVLSTLWIFVTLNYLYCDLMGLMDADSLKQFLTGSVNGMQMNQSFLLGAAILMEIPIGMVLLSRTLKQKANRLTNIIAGIIMTLVQVASLFLGPPTKHYIFYSIIEISATAFIAWYAINWTVSETAAID